MALSSATRTDSDGPSSRTSVASTGIPGLDSIIGGGFPRDHLYLIDGDPGTGKTTLALQFLLAGRDAGERGLYVTLSETTDELRSTAASHDWTLDDVDIFELSPAKEDTDEVYTLFHPAEIELQQTVETVLDAVARHRPVRLVFDSLSEMRLLARDPLRFRRQILALKQFFVGRQCTVLLLDDRSGPAAERDHQPHSIAHGVIILEQIALDYGAERRRLQVGKLRGVAFHGGYHDFRIKKGGLSVYPRLLHTSIPVVEREATSLSSGSPELDSLLGGGLTKGTSMLIAGAAGTGKSTLCLQYAREVTRSGKRALYYLFDERVHTVRIRIEGLGLDMGRVIEEGRLRLRQVEPTEMSPGELALEVMTAVREDDVTLVMFDSVNGFLQAMPSERLLSMQIHELLSALANAGATTIMTLVQRGGFGAPIDEAAEVSYLADTVLLLRYFEHAGTVRQAISVVKKRSGMHERTIRECLVEAGGFHVGEPLRDFRGVLTGLPEYFGPGAPLMTQRDGGAREDGGGQ
ncbi:MAG TPA: ATPase domain-containing protein [Gemmatimonadaceae bacterium]|jgi:circadian clock protein KaiC|nr:ATPase domain-containing protein [Gemmatimonadaceae bacterium]